MQAHGLIRLAALAAVLMAAPADAQPGAAAENVVLAVPNVALTFAPGYLAEDLGLFTKHGLNVKSVVITGIGSTNAVISGSADFAQASARRSRAPPRAGNACSASSARSTGRSSRSSCARRPRRPPASIPRRRSSGARRSCAPAPSRSIPSTP